MSRHKTILVAVLAVLLLTSACQGASPSPVPAPSEPSKTLPMAEAPTVTPLPTRAVVATPLPTPTPTPSPVPTQAPTPTAPGPAITVPPVEAPVVDGTMAPGEWDGAVVETFSDGSELLLGHSDGYLYLGIRSATADMIVGNVFVEHGDEIRILHSSAALGTAIYQQGADAWQRAQDFAWRCRDTGQSESAQAKRDAFLEEEHWVAANSRMGAPNELEFQIELAGDTLRMAVNLIRTTATDVKVPWPAGLDDDCIKPTPGGLPVELSFSPSQWATVAISPAD